MKLLLHICCANCATYTVEALRSEGIEPVGFWYNPNIHPYTEYRKRLESLLFYAQKVGLRLEVDDFYGLLPFMRRALEKPAFPERCIACYEERLERAARFASENGYDAFTTTLLYSKYQNHDAIRGIGERLGKEYKLDFLYRDFRQGWREGIEMSKKMALYRQQYCGCILSEYERFGPKDVKLPGVV